MFLANPGDPNRKGIDLRNLENSVPAGKRRRKQSPEATAAASQKRRRAETDEAVAGPIQSVKPIGSNQASTSAPAPVLKQQKPALKRKPLGSNAGVPSPSDLVRVPKSVLDGIHAELRQLREKIASNDQVLAELSREKADLEARLEERERRRKELRRREPVPREPEPAS